LNSYKLLDKKGELKIFLNNDFFRGMLVNVRIVLFTLLLAVLCITGCKTISSNTINIESDDYYRNIKTLAVMRFDDERMQGEKVKGIFVKVIKNPDAGGMLADMMTNELSGWGKIRVLRRSEVKDRVRTCGAKESELVEFKDYAAVRRILKVDAVVIGKIYKFGLVNMPVYERGHVSFTAECIDTKNGKILWSIEANESASYNDEIELATKVIKELIEKLEKEVE